MTTRREALKLAGSALAAAALAPPIATFAQPGFPFPSKRPAPANRAFTSQAVEDLITEVSREISDPEIAWLFSNCYPNTLDTTVECSTTDGKPDTFVITGDIHAMWLRDSSAQVYPYVSLVGRDERLKQLVAGVIRRQARCILIDPYANAFNKSATGSEWAKDHTEMKPELHERKWEIDSLCYPIRLSYAYWKFTGDKKVFDRDWVEAMRLVVSTFRVQQRKESPGPYHFQRETSVWYDTLPQGGYGNPTRPVGLIHSGFRPSDDACIYPFLIPSNLFAMTALRQLSEIVKTFDPIPSFLPDARSLAEELEAAIRTYGIITRTDGRKVYAYEVDGFGNTLFMDDANVPSLLGLPVLGCCEVNDPIYQSTRKAVLSDENPYYYKGKEGEGIGGPHVGPDMIWPISIIMRAMTSTDDAEILGCLRILKKTHAGTGFMHESFQKDDASKFTRSWFAWANTLFGDLILRLYYGKPDILKHM
jgi:meiotically up-regulated gene 157 (Mug157) protein